MLSAKVCDLTLPPPGALLRRGRELMGCKEGGDDAVGCNCDPGYTGTACDWELVYSWLPDAAATTISSQEREVVGRCSIADEANCVCLSLWFGPRCQISVVRYMIIPALLLGCMCVCLRATFSRHKSMGAPRE
jgi:hypothetical protein